MVLMAFVPTVASVSTDKSLHVTVESCSGTPARWRMVVRQRTNLAVPTVDLTCKNNALTLESAPLLFAQPCSITF